VRVKRRCRQARVGTGQRFGWNVGYRRAFLPSYGFGGTFENQEFSAGFLAALMRRLDWSGTLAYRVNDPLVPRTTTLVPTGLPSPSIRKLKVPSPVMSSVIGKPQIVLSGSTTKWSSIGKWPLNARPWFAPAVATASPRRTASETDAIAAKRGIVDPFLIG